MAPRLRAPRGARRGGYPYRFEMTDRTGCSPSGGRGVTIASSGGCPRGGGGVKRSPQERQRSPDASLKQVFLRDFLVTSIVLGAWNPRSGVTRRTPPDPPLRSAATGRHFFGRGSPKASCCPHGWHVIRCHRKAAGSRCVGAPGSVSPLSPARVVQEDTVKKSSRLKTD
jgi:hypothetical protein